MFCTVFLSSFSISCMAIGGLLALFLFKSNNILKILFSKYTQWSIYVLLILLMSYGVKIPMIHYEFYGLLFGVIILNLAANKNSILNIENVFFDYLGKISYGLYMYHPLCIVISLKTLLFFDTRNIFLQYIFSIGLTIVISGLSYKYFESFFIRKKKKFTKILSGDNVKHLNG